MKTLLSIIILLSFGFAVHSQNLKEVAALESKIESLVKKNNTTQAGTLLLELGDVYQSSGQNQKAEIQYKKAIDIFKTNKNWELKINAYNKLGKIYSKQANYKGAIDVFKNSLEIAEQYAPQASQLSAYIQVGITYNNLNKGKFTLHNLEKAALIAEKINNNELARYCYDLLIDASKKYKKAKKTVIYQEKYQYYNDLLAQEEIEETEQEVLEVKQKVHKQNQALINSSLELYKQKIELEKTEEILTEEKEINKLQKESIKLLEREKELKEVKIKALNAAKEFSRTINIIIFCIAVFLTGIAVYIYYIFRQQVKRKRLIRSQKNYLQKQHEKLADQHEKITSSINYAQRIQAASLPTISEIETRLKNQFILFKPRDVVSGDFYWFYNPQSTNLHSDKTSLKIQHTEKEYLIAAIDCTGHGVPGAFMSMIGFNILNRIVSNGELSPAEILSQLHAEINAALNQEESQNVDGMDMVICSVNEEKKELTMAGAKNSLVYIQNNELTAIKGDIYPIGGAKHGSDLTFTNHTVKFDQTTHFYMYSDGYIDQFGGPNNKKFMSKKFKNLLLDIHQHPVEEQKLTLENTINDWMGKEHKQLDDILVWGFKLE